MSTSNVHIINHTHWDREWFLTSIYTSRWIPGLIDRLEALVQANPSFAYLLDGQTLVVEDLLALDPHYEGRVRRLIENGNLLTGPYYCQPDWQITGDEALVRNLVYGIGDVQRLGGQVGTGWLVDTFGHISQSPQIHRMAGIEQVYVWRGVPAVEPYFQWQAPDGSRSDGDLPAWRLPQPVRCHARAGGGGAAPVDRSRTPAPLLPHPGNPSV
jgi:alpha-mannosidase